MELSSDITAEDLQVFLQEAEEHLQLLDEDIVRLEREQANPELLQEIFRAAHTLKGSSAMLGHHRMAELAHSMESVLDGVRKGDLPITAQVVDALLHGLDDLTLLKEELVTPDAVALDIAAMVAQLEQVLRNEAGEAGVDAAQRVGDQETSSALCQVPLTLEEETKLQSLVESGFTAYQVHVNLIQGTTWAAVRCFQILESLGDVGTVVSSSPSMADVESGQVGLEMHAVVASGSETESIRNIIEAVDEIELVEVIPYSPFDTPADSTQESVAPSEVDSALDESTARKRNQGARTVRIDVDRLDDMMDLIGELVIDHTRIVQIGKILKDKYGEDDLIQALGKTSAHLEKIVDELRESAMKVRMLPIGTAFNGFPRMMRDLAQKINKKINFIVDGQETEIDRAVIDRIRDPLVHLLRNSLDHGIESLEERTAAGKPEQGTIRLSAHHEQGHIVITVEDDGRGIDAQKIRDSAVSKGLITAETATRLTDSESVDLIFLPGASTAAKTTDISGRGVGMDIVKSNIGAINGFVNVETTVGQGSKFTLKLPLTLAKLRALLVSLDDTTYAIPLVYVLEAVMLRHNEISTVDRREVIRLRGNVIPLLRLGTVLEIGNSSAEPDYTWVVVVRIGERLVALAVDALVELQEIVVKSLGDYIGDVKGVGGVSMMGDGRVVLILDVPTLLALSVQQAYSFRGTDYTSLRKELPSLRRAQGL